MFVTAFIVSALSFYDTNKLKSKKNVLNKNMMSNCFNTECPIWSIKEKYNCDWVKDWSFFINKRLK